VCLRSGAVSDPADEPTTVEAAKRELRRRMRQVRREVDGAAGRSAAIWDVVRALPALGSATVVMVYEAVQGEPDSTAFVESCRVDGKVVVIPDPSPSAIPPVDPTSIDVVVVPGLAFTPAGERLGQGGGWYDRVLAQLRDDALTVGVCFEVQIVDAVPSEPHDVVLDVVISESGVRGGADVGARSPGEP
jgi:5-formyltetrahydrofolate cyclo-ligase